MEKVIGIYKATIKVRRVSFERTLHYKVIFAFWRYLIRSFYYRRVRHTSINENENDDYDSESISSSFSSLFSFQFGGKSFGSFKNSSKPERERSKSENHNPISITHPHVYTGIGKISRATQTSLDLGSPSIWSTKFKHCAATQ